MTSNKKSKNIWLNSQIQIEDGLTSFQDSLYLVLSNRKRCNVLLSKRELSEEDMVDIYISLHLVLEISLNALHRQIIAKQITKPIDRLDVIRNIDNIGFIEKTTLFIYNSSFDFGGKEEESAIHHKIISKLKVFAGVRNKLLHGHSIGSFAVGDSPRRNTEAKKALELNKLREQVKLFVDINKGMQFFLNHLAIKDWSKKYIEDLKKQYLTYDFIPNSFLNEIQQ